MEPVKRYPFGGLSALDAPTQGDAAGTPPATVLQLTGSPDGVGTGVAVIPRSPPRDWSKLIDRIRQAAEQVRAVQAHAYNQELRVQDVLDRVRDDVRNAAERVRSAEARTAEIQSRADALLKAADEKAKAAEERARAAEDWLARVYDAVATEFAAEPDVKRIV